MRLSDVDIIPGVVEDAEDPKFLGRIKCVAPGLFDTQVMDVETLPWVYPWFMMGYQRFSKMLKGKKVWIIRNKANKGEYWYLPMFEYIDCSREYISANYGNDPELVISRDSGGKFAQFYYDDTNGFVEKLGDDHIKLMPGNEIELKGKETKVKIKGSKVWTGTDNETYEMGVLGETLQKLLYDLQGAFVELSSKALSNPHTQELSGPFKKAAEILNRAEDITAKNTCIN